MHSMAIAVICKALDEAKVLVKGEKYLAAAHLLSGLTTELIKIHVLDHQNCPLKGTTG